MQVPTADGGRALVNLLPGGESEAPFTAYESGAFRVTLADASDGSLTVSRSTISDNDGGGRNAKVAWYGSEDNAWQSPSNFGTVELVE